MWPDADPRILYAVTALAQVWPYCEHTPPLVREGVAVFARTCLLIVGPVGITVPPDEMSGLGDEGPVRTG